MHQVKKRIQKSFVFILSFQTWNISCGQMHCSHCHCIAFVFLLLLCSFVSSQNDCVVLWVEWSWVHRTANSCIAAFYLQFLSSLRLCNPAICISFPLAFEFSQDFSYSVGKLAPLFTCFWGSLGSSLCPGGCCGWWKLFALLQIVTLTQLEKRGSELLTGVNVCTTYYGVSESNPWVWSSAALTRKSAIAR